MIEDERPAVGVAAPPGGHTRQRQLLTEERLGDGRQERAERRVLDDTTAERVDDDHVAPATGLEQAGHAELGLGTQFEWIAVPGIDPAQDHVDRLDLTEGPQVDPSPAHEQVAALDQAVAQVRGDERVLERRLGP